MTRRLMTAFAVAGIALAYAPRLAQAEERTLVGTVSDSLCGMSHKAMMEKQGSKISDRDCVVACLNYQTTDSPKLVVAASDGTVYMIANQKFPGLMRRAGEKLSVTGDVSGKTITVSKIEQVK